MAGHTPGPWKFEDEYVRDDMGDIVADPYTMPSGQAGDEMEANALLIAAAPELLEALEALADVSWTHLTGGYQNLIEDAQDAIRKAKGE